MSIFAFTDFMRMSFFKVSFESVGGLDKHIRSLKEMIVFPLLYPEVFEKFKIAPPRGVLFYGPPGMSAYSSDPTNPPNFANQSFPFLAHCAES